MSTDAAIAEEPDTANDETAERPAGSPDAARLAAMVEAVLITSDRPAQIQALADAISTQLPIEVADIEAAIEALNQQYDDSGRAFRIEAVAGGVRLMTRPEFAGVLEAHHRRGESGRLSKPALETLAIIAYRQPITRAQLEAIRGVGCGEVLRGLIDRRLVMIKGRAEELGRPMLYGTTKNFLDAFGLASIKDLPASEEPGSSS